MPLMKQVLPETGMFACDGEESNPDRISDLPDELLLHVMYFLTLQEAEPLGIFEVAIHRCGQVQQHGNFQELC